LEELLTDQAANTSCSLTEGKCSENIRFASPELVECLKAMGVPSFIQTDTVRGNYFAYLIELDYFFLREKLVDR
jgi:hypothetical protein